jgi:hypothetical protein
MHAAHDSQEVSSLSMSETVLSLCSPHHSTDSMLRVSRVFGMLWLKQNLLLRAAGELTASPPTMTVVVLSRLGISIR